MSCKNSIISIANDIKDLFKSSNYRLPSIAPQLLYIGANFRGGLDSKMIASKIIQRQSEAGAPTGAMPDGSANVMEAMYAIMVEEIINAIVLDARVDVVIPEGSIKVIANGANAGGPVVSTGTNTLPTSGVGAVR